MKYLLRPDVHVVFDIDGVLAAYEFGTPNHAIPDEDWDKAFQSEQTPYQNIQPLPLLQKFCIMKDPSHLHTCSKAASQERAGKMKFVLDNYPIPKEHIHFVSNALNKIDILEEIYIQENLSDFSKIVIVDDTIKNLNAIYNDSLITTVHISSFFDNDYLLTL